MTVYSNKLFEAVHFKIQFILTQKCVLSIHRNRYFARSRVRAPKNLSFEKNRKPKKLVENKNVFELFFFFLIQISQKSDSPNWRASYIDHAHSIKSKKFIKHISRIICSWKNFSYPAPLDPSHITILPWCLNE